MKSVRSIKRFVAGARVAAVLLTMILCITPSPAQERSGVEKSPEAIQAETGKSKPDGEPAEPPPGAPEGSGSDADRLSEPESEPVANWEFFSPLSVPAAAPAAAEVPTPSIPSLAEVILVPRVFTHARPDLADLRLFDAAGRAVPYALRYLRSRSVRDRVPAEEFNRLESDDGSIELTLDIRRDDIQHNEVEILTTGDDFRRNVEVEASDDGRNWRQLATGELLQYKRDEQEIKLQSVSYSPSRFRFVRLKVWPDPNHADPDNQPEEFRITEARILRHLELPGEILMIPGMLGSREPVRTFNAPGSAWFIGLRGERVPCDRIEVEIADAEFAREVQIEYELPREGMIPVTFQPVALISDSFWQRKAGEPKRPMVARFHEIQTSRLRLKVTDYRNPPLTIQSVRFGAAARQVVFPQPAGDQKELRLFFGNPNAEPPNYDFGRNLPERLSVSPVRASLGETQKNPEFVPTPKQFTERFPWLIYFVLSSVAIALAGVIFSLSRTALAERE